MGRACAVPTGGLQGAHPTQAAWAGRRGDAVLQGDQGAVGVQSSGLQRVVRGSLGRPDDVFRRVTALKLLLLHLKLGRGGA